MKPLGIWNSYVGGGSDALDEKELVHLTKTSKILPLKDTKQSKIVSLNDTAFMAANTAAANMDDKTTGSTPIMQTLHETHVQQVDTRKKQKQTAKKANAKDALIEKRPRVTKTGNKNIVPAKRFKKVGPEEPTVRVLSLEEHNMRMDDDEIFHSQITSTGRDTRDIIITRPPANDVLAFCARHVDHVQWYTSMLNHVSANDNVDFPDVPCFSATYLAGFLNEPDPMDRSQRPCFNLNRDPAPYEQSMRCIGHVMSEEILGVGNGFRLREFLFDGSDVGTGVPEMCYLCHLWTGLRDCIEQRDQIKTKEAEESCLTTPKESVVDNDNVVIINRFMVCIGSPGEYDRSKMLTGDTVGIGIWGAFPLFNRDNYIYVKSHPKAQGCRGFIESDNLFFRPAQAMLGRTESLPRTLSTQQTRTQKVSRSTPFHQ